MQKFLKILRISSKIFFSILTLALAALIALYLYLEPKLPSIEGLSDIQLQVPLRIYSAEGGLIAEYGEKRRSPKAIDEGTYRPGSRLVESELAERFGVSRTPIREALQRLSWEGFVTVRPRAGITIATLNASDWLKVIDARRGLEEVLARFDAEGIEIPFPHRTVYLGEGSPMNGRLSVQLTSDDGSAAPSAKQPDPSDGLERSDE